VGLSLMGSASLDPGRFIAQQLDLQLSRDCLGDICLYRQDVVEIAIVVDWKRASSPLHACGHPSRNRTGRSSLAFGTLQGSCCISPKLPGPDRRAAGSATRRPQRAAVSTAL